MKCEFLTVATFLKTELEQHRTDAFSPCFLSSIRFSASVPTLHF